ncbi:hypothetical protein DL546_005330 [Coniochaeta pulveracea]|uniref:Uncharacterized protein n=1 Tax=Coniochaeta pulveracea TaxID=177199 RepID=A0A420YIS6_9PEZI|nr:hypothetical protein DL546_005330 [Coniochaeta pulveracea]
MPLSLDLMTDMVLENRAFVTIEPDNVSTGNRIGPMQISVKSTHGAIVSPDATATAYLVRYTEGPLQASVRIGRNCEGTTTRVHSFYERPADPTLLGQASESWAMFYWPSLPPATSPGAYQYIVLFKLDGHTQLQSYVKSEVFQVSPPESVFTEGPSFYPPRTHGACGTWGH